MADFAGMPSWGAGADRAAAAIETRHLRRVWGLPATTLGVSGWPATATELRFHPWNFWWQAHLIDVAVDAAVRTGSAADRARVARLIRSHRLKNGFSVVNDYYDDMAWLALALERADRLLGISTSRRRDTLRQQFLSAWKPERGGGIPWRKTDLFFNTPANGPAAIFLARAGDRDRAIAMSGWLHEHLTAPTGLIIDGVDAADPATGTGPKLHPEIYTYCQGVVIGLDTELAATATDPEAAAAHAAQASALISAVAAHLLLPSGAVKGQGGGDGGLFAGILLRYLALAARHLTAAGAPDGAATARRIVIDSATAA